MIRVIIKNEEVLVQAGIVGPNAVFGHLMGSCPVTQAINVIPPISFGTSFYYRVSIEGSSIF